MTLETLKKALVSACRPCGVAVSHYTALKKPDQYVVWAEDSQTGGLWADGVMDDSSVQGTVHYFTRTENDPNTVVITNALTGAGIPYRLNSIQYEEETEYIHYEWVFEVFGNGNDSV